MYIWHNGSFKTEDTPVFRSDDRIRLGDGVFDTVLAVDGRPVHADLHYSRMVAHAAVLGLPVPYGFSEFSAALARLLKKNGHDTGRAAINAVLTRGPAPRGLMSPEKPETQMTLRASPLPEKYPPLHAVISQTVRRNEFSPLSRIKSLNYGDNILALKEAQAKGANEALLLNTGGYAACATIGNIFAVLEGKLLTPPLADGAVDGIARKLLLERCGAEEKSLYPEDMKSADALYITNSLRGAVPVLSLDGKKRTNAGLPGIEPGFYLT